MPRPLPPPVTAPPPEPEPIVFDEELPEDASAPAPEIAEDMLDQDAEDQTPQEQSPEPKSVEPEPDWDKIPLVSDLPPEIRDELSDLTINVHGYFENPARRVVFINMRRYKVGDRMGDGQYLLEAITPEGVVINYGEGRARLLVKR